MKNIHSTCVSVILIDFCKIFSFSMLILTNLHRQIRNYSRLIISMIQPIVWFPGNNLAKIKAKISHFSLGSMMLQNWCDCIWGKNGEPVSSRVLLARKKRGTNFVIMRLAHFYSDSQTVRLVNAYYLYKYIAESSNSIKFMFCYDFIRWHLRCVDSKFTEWFYSSWSYGSIRWRWLWTNQEEQANA